MERVGAVLRDLGAGDALLRRLAQARALEHWSDIVGPQLARCTRGLRVADGRLVVLAPGAALRQELTFHKRTILRKFNEAVGRRDARDVVFLESDSMAWEGTSPPVRPRVRRAEQDPEPAHLVGDEEAEEPEEEEGAAPDVVPSFDAEEYRSLMERIAREGDRAPREKR